MQLFFYWYLLFFWVAVGKTLICHNPNNSTICFVPMWGDKIINSNTYYTLPNTKDSLQLETLQFYISNIAFLKNGDTLFVEKNSYHLIDFSDSLTQTITLQHYAKNADQIIFSVGIDSLTNVSGAMGGDLDPTKGMYWTWQSGYINIKVEGKSLICPTRKNRFQFHLGGYLSPFQTVQNIALPTKSNNSNLIIPINIALFFTDLDLSLQNNIMIPGVEAQILSRKFLECFEGAIKK